MILADIGNRHAHVWVDGNVVHLSVSDAIESFASKKLYYISVNEYHKQELSKISSWVDISGIMTIPGEYDGLGVDRKALCLSREDGVYVDAGSAITVDLVKDGHYQGGFILPGIHAYMKAFSTIAPVLDIELNENIDIDVLPRDTRSGVSYGVITSVVFPIEKLSEGGQIYITGGSGKLLSKYFEKALFSEMLLFEGMSKIIKGIKC
jgi:type III pantothenate kinase